MRFLMELIVFIIFGLGSIAFPYCMYKLTSMHRYGSFIKAMKAKKWVLIVSVVFVIIAVILLIDVIKIGGQLSNSVVSL